MQNKYEISVLVLTYNFIYNNLIKTLDSIISQKNINFEIVIADDGSENNHKKEIIDYFKDKD